MDRPEGFGPEDLSDYRAVIIDGSCGEPIGWGFRILRRLGDERFGLLHKFGALECVDHMRSGWALVTKWLTPEEAIQKYGPITNLHVGPRGGFKTITYGDKRFMNKIVAPPDFNVIPDSVVTVEEAYKQPATAFGRGR